MEEKDGFDVRSIQWFTKKDDEIKGPLKWDDVSFMLSARELDKKDCIKSEMDNDWIQISDYPDFNKIFSQTNRGSIDSILPDGTDAIFMFGLLAFFIGAVIFFIVPLIGLIILVISLIFEIGGVVYSFRFKPADNVKTVGNIIAIIWTCFQGLVTLFFLLLHFS